MNYFKSLLFLFLAPGILGWLLPLTVFQGGPQLHMGIFSYLAFPVWIAGILILLWCFWDFAHKGFGTPVPIDPPRKLVISGLYRFVRNPMYAGVLLTIGGHFLWLGYWILLGYAGIFFLVVHAFVTLYEEPDLKERFGPEYESYLRKVPRWIPTFKSPTENS
jgi:protein-S-isoprenylcysteine O-methyltransferase Ste14